MFVYRTAMGLKICAAARLLVAVAVGALPFGIGVTPPRSGLNFPIIIMDVKRVSDWRMSQNQMTGLTAPVEEEESPGP